MHLTERFELALVYATRLHSQQLRKGSQTPYIAHLLSVSSLVLENGGDEDQAIAALLHDAVEDQGGLPRLEEIHTLFGKTVANIVEGCTDAFEKPKPPWQERKEAYLAHLHTVPPETRLVSLADKLHNAHTILTDLRQQGNRAWDRFNGGKTGTIWYYQKLVEIFAAYEQNALFDEFSIVVSEITRVSKEKEMDSP